MTYSIMKLRHLPLLEFGSMIDLETLVDAETLQGYELLRDDSGLVELPHLARLWLLGEDRKGWLQGQATNDVRKLEGGTSSLFCFTTVTGHLMSVCEAWAAPDRILITCPESTKEAVLRRVEQMVIMEDVTAEDAGQQYTLLSVQGPSATQRLSKLVSLPSLDTGEAEIEGSAIYVLRSNRTGMGGWDLWIPTDAAKALEAVRSEFATANYESYDIARLEAGIPMFGTDMTEKTFPPEMGKAFEERHVSYSKGCYMGQEVLMRIHSRGHTNRTWVGLTSESPIPAGAVLAQNRRSDAGIVTSSRFSPDYGHIAGAMLRNEFVFDGEIVQVQTESGPVDAEVRLMPLLR